jgi:Kef-type K+ transport system membrane component KefB
MTGVVIPIALSFVTKGLLGGRNLQCFAAGAAVCSTSLGTTLTVLRTGRMTRTGLGAVLTSAAILEDFFGLYDGPGDLKDWYIWRADRALNNGSTYMSFY